MASFAKTQIRPTEYILQKTTILIVDDEAGPRESLRMILSPAHKVIFAECGSDALDILRTTQIDLVTLDLNMPGIKGDEVMRTIRREFPSIEIIIITGCQSIRTAVEGLRYGICDYISKPFDVVQVSSAVSRALARKQSRTRLVDFLEGIGTVLGKDRDSRELLDELLANPELQNRLATALEGRDDVCDSSDGAASSDSTLEFLDILAQALESRSTHLRGHAQRVGFYADLLAESVGAAGEEREHIRIASFLHDLGRVGLSVEAQEHAQLRGSAAGIGEDEHPAIGERLVQPLGFSQEIARAIRHHHEQWDGDGFPDELEGNDIPLASRIIAVVDAFDAMVSDRPGEETLSREAAIEDLEKGAGTRYDPALVREFVSLVESGACELTLSESPQGPQREEAGR